ncbi:4-hydroxy-tetrahydrodipicolinate synthase [Oxalobacter aliiformigenes]|uniref:4-hydroxy-tetrahydrodipicolinate synthase n=1 Tax=Oxalobacter aliiformigenes TaxID=2946593 RepID=UPI0022AF01E8|nr:4-hydroxy-tetrahydrodipicolinate synthase [Oxalobacter aliiformigenes]MCZ4063912.1 4-hydroxy-tetrahydrodipicolinate synthase [Oxalobacter aliiformigenes]WAV98534.1 4-hydroxy-tetrahydrodipicolinate synthase [Oxalobacter aliiformigenes]
MKIEGSIVALVTPMNEDGSVDLDSARRLMDWQIAEGTDALSVVGTTGESPTVNVDEHAEMIRVAVEHSGKRIPVIAGAGGNSTAEAIALTRYAQMAGADASLQVVPYYNKPTQEGMYQHFKSVAEAVDLPMILYNVPGRTVADLSNETILRLSEIPNIIGVKDATGNIARGIDLLRRVPEDFAVYSGDDSTAMALMLCGAKGNISVVANVAPKNMHLMCAAAIKGDVVTARKLNDLMLPLSQQLFVEANPIPVKWALTEMGMIPPGIRLPLVPLAAGYHDVVRKALKEAGVLA